MKTGPNSRGGSKEYITFVITCSRLFDDFWQTDCSNGPFGFIVSVRKLGRENFAKPLRHKHDPYPPAHLTAERALNCHKC